MKHNLSGFLEKYSKTDILPMHMPGHKRNKRFHLDNPYEIDVTEVRGMDNLHKPEGIIRDLMNDITQQYNSDQSYLLVNGSTSGLLSAITACCRHGDQILVARNCHSSVYHAIQLLELRPLYVYPDGIGEEAERLGIAGIINSDRVQKLLYDNPDVRCVVITSPTYEGIVSPIDEIAQGVHSFEIPLIVDEAHGAHFNWHDAFPPTALSLGADLVVESLHKTLPAFTQTAVIHAKFGLVNRERLEWCLCTYQSSSPSYVLMAGIDRCFAYIEKEGGKEFEQYVLRLKAFREKMKCLKKLNLYSSEAQELSKLVIVTGHTCLNGAGLADLLYERFHIETEMSCGNYCIAMTSVCDEEESFDRLARALISIDESMCGEWKAEQDGGRNAQNTDAFRYIWDEPEQKMYCYETVDMQKEQVELISAKGRVAAAEIFLYPPGIPLVVPGEVIGEKLVTTLQRGQQQGYTVQGAENGFVSVIRQ